MATTAQRAHVGAVIREMAGFAAQLDYPPGDNRDSRDSAFWRLNEGQAFTLLGHGGRLQFDCSEWCPWALRCAGLWHWADPGWTGSHLKLLTQHYTDARIALTGALVVFGPGGGDHEAIVYQPDKTHGNPTVAGHGRPGFDIEKLSVVAARHRPPVTFLSIAHL